MRVRLVFQYFHTINGRYIQRDIQIDDYHHNRPGYLKSKLIILQMIVISVISRMKHPCYLSHFRPDIFFNMDVCAQ